MAFRTSLLAIHAYINFTHSFLEQPSKHFIHNLRAHQTSKIRLPPLLPPLLKSFLSKKEIIHRSSKHQTYPALPGGPTTAPVLPLPEQSLGVVVPPPLKAIPPLLASVNLEWAEENDPLAKVVWNHTEHPTRCNITWKPNPDLIRHWSR